jgi:hypothetical protein
VRGPLVGEGILLASCVSEIGRRETRWHHLWFGIVPEGKIVNSRLILFFLRMGVATWLSSPGTAISGFHAVEGPGLDDGERERGCCPALWFSPFVGARRGISRRAVCLVVDVVHHCSSPGTLLQAWRDVHVPDLSFLSEASLLPYPLLLPLPSLPPPALLKTLAAGPPSLVSPRQAQVQATQSALGGLVRFSPTTSSLSSYSMHR